MISKLSFLITEPVNWISDSCLIWQGPSVVMKCTLSLKFNLNFSKFHLLIVDKDNICGSPGAELLCNIKQRLIDLPNKDASSSNIRTYIFIPNNLTKFGSQFLGFCLLHLVDASCGFGAHDTASPVTTDLRRKNNDCNGEFCPMFCEQWV